MACDTATLNVAPACIALTSPRRQLQATLFLLAAAANEIDGGFTIDWAAIRTAARAAVVCVPAGVARAKAAQVVEEGLGVEDLRALDCWSTDDLEQVRLYLTCTLVGSINP